MEQDNKDEEVKETQLPERNYFVPRAQQFLLAEFDAKLALLSLGNQQELCEISEAGKLEI